MNIIAELFLALAEWLYLKLKITGLKTKRFYLNKLISFKKWRLARLMKRSER